MKILLISEFFPTGKDLRFSGGVEVRTYFVGKHLAKNHDVHVICSLQPGSKRREKIAGIKVIRVGSPLIYTAGSGKSDILKLISFIYGAIKEGKKIRPDIIDGGNFIAHFIAKQITTSCKTPLVFWYPDVFIGNWVKTSGIVSGFGGWINEKINLLRGADQFIAISQTTRRKLINNGISGSKIKVIPCGVDLKEFVSSNNKSINFTIICISRLVAYKRVADLVWAFAILQKKDIKANLLIIGQGPEEKKLKEIVQMLKLKNKVTFKSDLKRDELIADIKSSEIFSLPSEIEGFGISTIEAAACGIPYAVSNIPVFKEITRNGQGGLLFQTGNISDLSTKLEKLLVNKKLYRQKSKEAKSLAKNYDWGKISMETEKVYLGLLNNK